MCIKYNYIYIHTEREREREREREGGRERERQRETERDRERQRDEINHKDFFLIDESHFSNICTLNPIQDGGEYQFFPCNFYKRRN